ncbi:hypothetical protein ElyMa_004956300 [Elysia marginata]|uniref:Uncharacterized protein n=1 Tax=Elysia marginata TaxID=1093978 RepID=A0AAV4J0Y9_9GAST|nr:hypothetical protein ElyMa_004956300 [Elysia marginata]
MVGPGRYSAIGLYLISRMSIHWHLIGVSERSFELTSGTKDLWSVGKVKLSKPIRYLSKRSHAHTDAKHSFSICVYFCSALENVLEQYATGFRSSSNSCSKQPPTPYDELSASTTVCFVGSKYASRGAVVSISLIWSNAAYCLGSQVQADSFVRN